jgi:hypothetical protein
MRGMGELIEGAMQHAPQPSRHFIKSRLLEQNGTNVPDSNDSNIRLKLLAR